MNLGQILSGNEAVSCYKRGVEVMLIHKRNQPADPNPLTPTISPIDQQLCQAFCALAELYLTDACYDDNAELECEKFLQAALQHNPLSAEAMYLMASMRISQQRPADALPIIQKSYNIWKEKAEELHKGRLEQEEEEENPYAPPRDRDAEAAAIIPPYDTRHNTARLFIELGHYKDALAILEMLVMENDQSPGVWYTYAQAHMHTVNFTEAFECLATAKKLISREGTDDEELVEKVEKLYAEVKQKLAAQGIEVDEQDDDENGMDDN